MIICKTPREIEIMREAGRIVALTHQELQKHIQPGITTKELDAIAEKIIRANHAIPSFKGYNGFRGSICASVNEELVHGIPGDRVLREGDIISIDIGAKYNGYHGDSAWTYPVGNISEESKKLLEVTEESSTKVWLKPNRVRDYPIYHTLFRRMLNSINSRSYVNMLDTALDRIYMKIRRFRIMVRQTKVRG